VVNERRRRGRRCELSGAFEEGRERAAGKGRKTHSDDGLSDSLSDGVNLGDLSSTLDLDSDVDLGELVLSDDEDGLVVLVSEEGGLSEGDGLSVESDESTSGSGVSDSGRGLDKRRKRGRERKRSAR